MRGESKRVAERVRDLLDDHGRAPRHQLGPDAALAAPTEGPGLWARLAARVPARIDPGRRVAIALGVAVALAGALTGAWVLAARPNALPVSSAPPVRAPVSTASTAGRLPARPASATGGSTSAAAAAAPAPSASARVVVDVAGKVRHPGLYRLPAGSRVDDAVRAAGGALPRVRLDGLNLAAKLVDGQQIPVGIAPAAGAGVVAGGSADGTTASGTAGEPSAAAPVDLNTANLEQLEALPGVGPVLAQHIVDWRTQHGRFGSVDQLQDVSGIGPAKFADLKVLVSV